MYSISAIPRCKICSSCDIKIKGMKSNRSCRRKGNKHIPSADAVIYSPKWCPKREGR